MTDRPTASRQEKGITVRCPECGSRGRWLGRAHAPFCSERCKLIDMGAWFEENYRISEPLRPDHFAGNEDLIIDPDEGQAGD